MLIIRFRNFMQEFLVKYAHKYAQKSTKICKKIFYIKCGHFKRNTFYVNFKGFY